MMGHSTGLRSVEFSPDDTMACTVSKNAVKVWNVARRKCVHSVSHSIDGRTFYGLCATYLPGNSHIIVGTREGHLLLLDVAAGDYALANEKAHDQAVWSLDLRRSTDFHQAISLVSGSADKTVKLWQIETNDDETPIVSHSRTLEVSDEVVAVRFSNSTKSSKRMIYFSLWMKYTESFLTKTICILF